MSKLIPVIFLFCASLAHAEIKLADLTFAGTGCPAKGEPVRAKFSSTGKRLVIYTPAMKIEDSKISRRACSIALEVLVAPDERVVIGRPSVFGKERLGEGQKLEAEGDVFFAGRRAISARVEFTGTEVASEQPRGFYKIEKVSRFSACGENMVVRGRAILLSQAPAYIRGMAMDVYIEKCPPGEPEGEHTQIN